jgi:formylglycine-generating enzyme required for sulfatase activity
MALRARAKSVGLTLQVKKSWLPNVTAPLKSDAPVERKPERKPQTPKADKPKSEKFESWKTASPRKPNTVILIAVIGFVGTIIGLISSPLLANFFERTPEPTTIASTPIKAFTPTATPYPTQITDTKGVTMYLVPAGEFTMGSEKGIDDERPAHQVYLDAFYMDIYEVTNSLYQACVDVGGCTPPQKTSSQTRSSYYGNSQFDDYPVIYVDWNMAKTYCEWRGDRLPTEAEWEKAARGTDGRMYPWGEDISCDKSNYNGCKEDTTKVGSYLNGVSPYGLYDMAGNVWEWVNDWYDSGYYQSSPPLNPLGPGSGQSRVLRGGSWDTIGIGVSGDGYNVRSAYRHYLTPDAIRSSVGFRCARSLP